MGLGIGAVKLNLELRQRGFFKGINRVVEMGAQELHLKTQDLEACVTMAGITNFRKEDFIHLDHFPQPPRCSSKAFYSLLGIKDYACVDMDSQHGALALDLNCPLEDKSLYGKFDLVTDYGTNEHVFNTAEAYRTMHRLCRPGGLIVIYQSAYSGNGYYAYDPVFFEGMAAANKYKILFSSYVINLPTPTPHGSADQYHVPLSKNLLGAITGVRPEDVGICYVMQKQSEEDFHFAYQYCYAGHYGFEFQYVQEPCCREYVPVFSLAGIPMKLLLQEVSRRLAGKFGLKQNK